MLGDTSEGAIKAQIFTVVADAPDVNGTTGVDKLKGTDAAEKLYGLVGDDRLSGLGGGDLLDGGTGNDVMLGGAGNDTYIVDAAGDKAAEKAGEGNDTVQTALAKYLLGANVENLTFTSNAAHYGIGNALANTIIGGGGNDRLNGRGGADTLKGGAGNDIYVLDQSGDKVIEEAGGGIDTVYAGFSAVSALGENIENLTLTGTGAFYGYGNAANNTLTGNAGDNTLSSATGNDRLNGLGGNDTLYGGFDNDALFGGDGDDKLYGGLGRDVLTGGVGADRFFFDSGPDAKLNFDKITDFVSGTDKLILSKNTFTGFAVGGALAEGAFQSGAGVTTAKDADDRLIYNTTTGKLYYDADGSDAASSAVLVAILKGQPALAFSDVLISA
ncbi:MAG: calcium-binding protein [Novosphingobium sp.]